MTKSNFFYLYMNFYQDIKISEIFNLEDYVGTSKREEDRHCPMKRYFLKLSSFVFS